MSHNEEIADLEHPDHNENQVEHTQVILLFAEIWPAFDEPGCVE